MTEITLEFIARQLDRVLAEQAGIRDEMLVLGARMHKVEASLDVLVSEVRAMRNSLSRIETRVTRLEDERVAP